MPDFSAGDHYCVLCGLVASGFSGEHRGDKPLERERDGVSLCPYVARLLEAEARLAARSPVGTTVQTACARCSFGVMDAENPHLLGLCQCVCHDLRDASEKAFDEANERSMREERLAARSVTVAPTCDLDAIEARANAATRGEMAASLQGSTVVVESEREFLDMADVTFYAAARSDVLALCAELRAWREAGAAVEALAAEGAARAERAEAKLDAIRRHRAARDAETKAFAAHQSRIQTPEEVVDALMAKAHRLHGIAFVHAAIRADREQIRAALLEEAERLDWSGETTTINGMVARIESADESPEGAEALRVFAARLGAGK